VIAVADIPAALALDSAYGERGTSMKSDKPLRRDRAELVARGCALAALLAGVLWAWFGGGATP